VKSLPHLYPPPPRGRGRIKEGEGIWDFYTLELKGKDAGEGGISFRLHA